VYLNPELILERIPAFFKTMAMTLQVVQGGPDNKKTCMAACMNKKEASIQTGTGSSGVQFFSMFTIIICCFP